MIRHLVGSAAIGLIAASLVAGVAVPPHPARAATAYQFQDENAEPLVSVSFSVKSAAAGSLKIVFDYRDADNYYALELAPHSAQLKAVVAGAERRLGGATVEWQGTSHVTLKRRPWVMQVIVDKRVVLTGYDATFDSGKIGSAASGGWSWQEVRVQPVEELYFADDFTRAEGQEGEWKIDTGKWTLTSSSENINARNVSMSANPFSYQVATPASKAFTHAGRWFWDNYHAEASVRPAGRGTVGLAAYVQDPQNYIAFLWNANGGPNARQLVRVVNGQPTVLASEPGGYLPRQWYRIGVRTSPGFVEAFVDGALALTARDNWFGQGGIGLIAQDLNLVAFDDVRVQSYSYYRQDLNGPVENSWTADGGTWTAANAVVTSAPKAGDNGASRFLVSGGGKWNGYQMTASARAGETGACGLVVSYQDDKDYSVFRWAGPRSAVNYHGRQQLMRYAKGNATIVSDEPLKLGQAAADNGFARLTLRLNPGALTVLVNGQPVAEVADESITAGKFGLWAQGTQPVEFKDVVVFFPPEPLPQKVPPKMEEDALMVGWASPSGEWPPTIGDNGAEFWNTGEFFGDASVEMIWRRSAYKRGKLELALRAQRGDFSSGYVVRCEAVPDNNGGLKVSLLKGAVVLKQTQFDWKQLDAVEDKSNADSSAGAAVPVQVEMEGQAVMLIVGGKPALSFLNPDAASAPKGTTIGARSNGFALRTKELRAVSSHRDDYTFTEAPTDWYTPSGVWNVISRWPCYSDWSFFGGKGLNPAIWTKRTYGGDVVVEMYAHNQMDLPKEIGYSHPGDLNITIGGDGKNPASGYSFVVAGWDNTKSRILKGTQIVAENNTEDGRFIKPINHYMPFHRRWFYIRAEARAAQKDGRNGVHIALTVDDTLLAEYFDADPLGGFQRGGHIGFWTVDGTIMIARAKIESAEFGPRVTPSDLVDPTLQGPLPNEGNGELAPRPVLTDGVPSTVVERGGSNAAEAVWTLRNPSSGGLFAVQLVKPGVTSTQPWRATPATKLDFDLALPKDVKIDLYVTLEEGGEEVLHLVAITNDQKPDARMRVLGTARAQPGEGGWQHISFDLGAALKKLYPDASSWKIKRLSLGALHGDEYRWVGFDGNLLGATYRLRGVKLAGATQIAEAPATAVPAASRVSSTIVRPEVR